MSAPKITMIGAGSITFAMTLIRDVIAKDELSGSTITLMDIDEQRLASVMNLASRLVKESKADLNFRTSLVRKEALEGADFVINTAALAEREQWSAHREIGQKHGYWPVKGFRLHMLRNTPLALAVARDVEEVCPQAWLLQYANPMVANIGAITRHTKVKAVGVCHGIPGTLTELAKWIGLDRTKIEAEAVGLNHFVWITRFRYEGNDAYPMLTEWLRSDAFRAVWTTEAWQQCGDTSGPICLDLLERFGLFPCNGDAHMSDYFPWYTTTEEKRRHYHAKMHYLESYLRRGEAAWQSIMQLVNDPSASVSSVFSQRSDEVAVELIDCLWNGRQGVFELTVPNHGSIPDFPNESALEVPVLVSSDAVRPLKTNGLPYSMSAHVRRRLAEEELQMEATIQQDKGLLVQAMLLDPYTQSPQQADAFLKDLAKAEKSYAPWLS